MCRRLLNRERRGRESLFIEDFHDIVRGDGEGGQSVRANLFEECRQRPDDVVERVKRVVVHPFDDLEAFGLCRASVVEHAGTRKAGESISCRQMSITRLMVRPTCGKQGGASLAAVLKCNHMLVETPFAFVNHKADGCA